MIEGKTQEELRRMTMKEIMAYAKEIGCCLGYDGSLKESAIQAVISHQKHLERVRREEGER